MKRFALAIFLVAVAATAVFLALHRPGAEASLGPTITVDSVGDLDYRDGDLTLREAMRLATGDLEVGDLYAAECLQVSGTGWVMDHGPCYMATGDPPGADYADTIVFDTTVFPPGSPKTIAIESGLPELDTGNDTVDGSSAGVIVDGSDWSFRCFGISSDNNTIKGLEIYNCTRGVVIDSYAQNNTIGGNTQAARNVISGHRYSGVLITESATLNAVKGNYIGTDASGTAGVPNEEGVLIVDGATRNTIGGTAAGKGNTIAFNDGCGVCVREPNTERNQIRRNSIHSNGGRGIDNENGGNTELTPPVVTGVGSVEGTACPDCFIEVYSDDEDEGRVYEGSTMADSSGNWSFSGTPEGPNVTATATDWNGNTSEFSAPVAVSEPTPSPTPSPTATPSPTPTGTPIPGATRTFVWASGWHNATWSGASTPDDAFACAAGNYAAAYRLVSGGWERYFPGRPEISNMADLEQYDSFLILVTGDVTCEMSVADPPGSERTLDWGVGWQNDGWTGADDMPPEDAFACAEGSFAAAYRLVGGGWERYFPDRPEISNMGALDEYDAFLILVTAPVNCTMAIAP
jgi:hypothetical protein